MSAEQAWDRPGNYIANRTIIRYIKGATMDFSTKTFDAKNTIAQAKSGCVAVAVYENKALSKEAAALDRKGEISAAVKSGDISGKPGTTLLLRQLNGTAADRILLVG